MKNVILKELADPWQKRVAKDVTRNGAPEAELSNAKKDGFNDGLLECAAQLKEVLDIFE